MGREWESPLGNAYASTIVRLKPTDPPAPTLAFVAALAVQRTLTVWAPGQNFQIKWPNDILSADGAKISGMLLERSNDAVVVGVGVNLASHPKGLARPVTSLAALGLRPPAPQKFVEQMAAEFAARLDQWRSVGLGGILAAWQAAAHPAGTPLIVHLPDGGGVQGHYSGLGDDGSLKLRLADGSIRAIHAADIFLI